MDSQIKLVGVIKEVTYRKTRTSESFLEKCDFNLESGERIICVGFYPTVRKGFKVKIVGKWSESGDSIIAESVERVNNQTRLDTYNTNQQSTKEVKEQ
jgi:hypothetical protein